MITYKFPPIKETPKTPGVYKMIFDTGHFYFGSSGRIHKRVRSWKERIKIGATQKLINELSKTAVSIEFVILHIIPDLTERLMKEQEYINENISNPLCLNILRKTLITGCKGYVKYVPDKNKKSLPKPIVRVDENNQIIERFNSVNEAVKKYNLQSKSPISLKNSRRTEYGMMFRYLDENGIPIINTPPQIDTRQLEITKQKRKDTIDRLKEKGIYSSNNKKIAQKDLYGNIIKIHFCLADAARHIGTKPKTFQSTIRESKTGFHKGYIWKYA